MATLLKPLLARDSPGAVAFAHARNSQADPEKPLFAALLTFRHDEAALSGVRRLVKQLLADPEARLMLVIATDADDANGLLYDYRDLQTSPRVEKVVQITNPARRRGGGGGDDGDGEPFPICSIWNAMATEAFAEGADWVALLGDDVRLNSPDYYQRTYASFAAIQERIQRAIDSSEGARPGAGVDLGFGCPWFDDTGFPGFPTFPVLGRPHFELMGGRLFPASRPFVNQDLDPYLHRLYLEFDASPRINATLSNTVGGGDKAANSPRYIPVPVEWKDWIEDDVQRIAAHLRGRGCNAADVKVRLVDVVVPSYRIPQHNLELITQMQVPANWRTVFIVIVDNPELMQGIEGGQAGIERRLSGASGHTVRVRTNATNVGASATRNAGIRESAAQWILFLDDDTEPPEHLLEEYERHLSGLGETSVDGLVGMLGLVEFPRQSLTLMQGAVLMSYLTFAFEVASFDGYVHPAWGVTANLMVRRVNELRFDLRYAKQGGGEDVDLCLRLAVRGRFDKVPAAKVEHPFWMTSFYRHFLGWALGDGALYARFPEHTYKSWPNASELLTLALPAVLLCGLVAESLQLLVLVLATDVAVDVLVDLARDEFKHRVAVIGQDWSIPWLIVTHCIANSYVWTLEFGRLAGHLRRGQPEFVATRFDWHCKKLPAAPRDFARKEGWKFACFVLCIAYVFGV